ncbi:SpoIIE family protein phosphatase [Candidatus Albibeggiatoa sp. nov. NOAA]|uniref:SpoIIE family protein phosphatase n=1 Tax=Candidatus Albibeggiatoa sp. nov. NOAA TaxID=3162724 RepID=UPI0033010B82|nr:SpoIIE family protein phosphatase [Thiotrichaceae bacterium]
MVAASKLSNFINTLHLRTALTLPFLLLICLSVGLTGWLSLRNGQLAVNEVTLQLRSEIGLRIHEHLNRYLTTPMIVNRYISNELTESFVSIDDMHDIARHFTHHLKAFPSLSHIQLGNQHGAFVGLERHNSGFYHLETVHHANLMTYKADAHGVKMSDTALRVSPNFDVKQQNWYKQTIEENESIWHVQAGKNQQWSHVLNFLGNTWLALNYSSPIHIDNQLVGVVSANLKLDDISQFLHGLKIGKQGKTFIIENDTGLLVATSSLEKLFQLDKFSVKIKRLAAIHSENPLIQATAKHLERHEKLNRFSFYLESERQLVEILPYQNNGLNWSIVVVVPESDFMDKIQHNTYTTISLMIFALLMSSLIGFFIVRWVTAPILSLSRAAQNLAQGHWEHQLPIERRDELGQLAVAFQSMANQLKSLFNNLEMKVAERTSELELAYEEIRTLNEFLKEDNTRLTAELDVTREFQQMILPKPKELASITELDIAGYMQPAEMVGGDYYDVLHYDDKVKIAIGDVTGHGLSSGMIMLMVQTALRLLFTNNICEPERCLTVLNRTIYDNVNRIETDKNLTLTVVDYCNGKARISGQHEEILLVRQNGEIERIDTMDLGFPIGLEADIQAFISDIEVTLHQGDGFILYTDGITEAENEAKDFYGMDRLCEVISCHWSKTAEQIKDAVIADVHQHIGKATVYDDITLLVIKQR